MGLGREAIGFLDALGVPRARVADQVWGAQVAQGLATLHPERVESRRPAHAARAVRLP